MNTLPIFQLIGLVVIGVSGYFAIKYGRRAAFLRGVLWAVGQKEDALHNCPRTDREIDALLKKPIETYRRAS